MLRKVVFIAMLAATVLTLSTPSGATYLIVGGVVVLVFGALAWNLLPKYPRL